MDILHSMHEHSTIHYVTDMKVDIDLSMRRFSDLASIFCAVTVVSSCLSSFQLTYEFSSNEKNKLQTSILE